MSKIKPLPEIAPCPFCGVAPTMEPWHGGGPMKRCIHCENTDCMVQPMTTGMMPRWAIGNWNRRAPVDVEAAERRGAMAAVEWLHGKLYEQCALRLRSAIDRGEVLPKRKAKRGAKRA